MKIKWILFFVTASFSFVLLNSTKAHATLGKTESSIETDRSHLKAAMKNKGSRNGYTVQVISSGNTTVREYVRGDGTVFGVAWNGVENPDIDSLLGDYAVSYKQLSDSVQKKFGARHHSVKSDQLVVERWGHMRDLRGKAYDPSLLPTGVSANEIK